MPHFNSRNVWACVLPAIIAVLSVYWFRKKRKLKPADVETAKLCNVSRESNHSVSKKISQAECQNFSKTQTVLVSQQANFVENEQQIKETASSPSVDEELVSVNLNKANEDLSHYSILDTSSSTKDCVDHTQNVECNTTEFKCNGYLSTQENDCDQSFNVYNKDNLSTKDKAVRDNLREEDSKQFTDSFLEAALTIIYDSDTDGKTKQSAGFQQSVTDDLSVSAASEQLYSEDIHNIVTDVKQLSNNQNESFSKTLDSPCHANDQTSTLTEFVQSTNSPSSNPSDCEVLSSVGTSSVSLNEFTSVSPLNSPHEQSSTIAVDSAIDEGEELSVDSGTGSTRGSISRSSGFAELENHSSVKQLVDTLLQSSNSDVFVDQDDESNKKDHELDKSQYNDNLNCELNSTSPLRHFTNARSEVGMLNDKSNSHVVETKTYDSTSHYVYEFELPYDLCGRLIGRQGKHVKFIKELTNASLCIKRHPYNDALKLVVVEGRRSDVNNALNQIRKRYPLAQYPNVTLVQTNASSSLNVPVPDSLQLHLPECVSVDVILSSMVTAGHFFLQQPTHPTYPSLATLDQCMIACYGQNDTPPLPNPIEAGIICAATIMGGWYRTQVMYVFDNGEECEIKYVDYGGYSRVSLSSLRQIRSDFMSLPFQASECYLANVQPLSVDVGWTQEASSVFEELAQGQILQAMVVDFHEDGIPYVHLYRVQGISSTFINQELVNRGFAKWVDHH